MSCRCIQSQLAMAIIQKKIAENQAAWRHMADQLVHCCQTHGHRVLLLYVVLEAPSPWISRDTREAPPWPALPVKAPGVAGPDTLCSKASGGRLSSARLTFAGLLVPWSDLSAAPSPPCTRLQQLHNKADIMQLVWLCMRQSHGGCYTGHGGIEQPTTQGVGC